MSVAVMSNCGDSVAVANESGEDRGVEDKSGSGMGGGIAIGLAVELEARRVKEIENATKHSDNFLMG